MQSILFQEWAAEFAEEAAEKAKLEDAENLLREGDSVARVARVIKLPIEKIQALKREIEANG
ncbi:MAG: hypothetical protein LBS84_09975 [Clostridiales bacterium]|nr:hypothetical protein [Clostridiales bacterium]